MVDVNSFFNKLDEPFLNYNNSNSNEPITFKAVDLLITSTFDLKIPIIVGSTVKYSFSTKIGDINFSTEFRSISGDVVDSIVSPMRVPSDIETIKGSYKAEKEGTFVLVFDNSFSWFNPKTLTYNVELMQPAFTMADTNRVRQSQRLLHTTIEDTRRAELRLITAQDRSNTLGKDVSQLEARIAALRLEIDNKRGVLKAARDEVEEMTQRINYNLEKKNGLCIRCLDKRALTLVLLFVGKSPTTYLVCKYWKACIDDNSKLLRWKSTKKTVNKVNDNGKESEEK